MSTTWQGGAPPERPKMGPSGVANIILRGFPLAILVFGGLACLLCLRLVERPIFKEARPWTPYLTVGVCRGALWLLGIKLIVRGTPLAGQGAVVANHSSWLDIFVLNASKRIYFVSKSEVASWPGIGWLARATGTVFVERNRKKAGEQTTLFRQRLAAGHKLLFFPEGTSSDGSLVLPFKSTLFAAFFDAELREHLQIQPVAVKYSAPKGQDPRFYGWWGDMDFGTHLMTVLAHGSGGQVSVHYGTPLPVNAFEGRKSLAKTSEDNVRQSFMQSG